MTLAMPDSVTVADLPPGYDAYLGYADGKWPTGAALRTRFPQARLVILTVTGATLDADGCDVETGDLSAADGRAWVQKKIAAHGTRPVIYASVAPMAASVLPALERNGIPRSSVRLLTAHYGAGAHICGPATCGQLDVAADGTQWTCTYPGVSGAHVDMSVLDELFFGDPLNQTGTVHSDTTGGNAKVTSTDGGNTWRYTP